MTADKDTGEMTKGKGRRAPLLAGRKRYSVVAKESFHLRLLLILPKERCALLRHLVKLSSNDWFLLKRFCGNTIGLTG